MREEWRVDRWLGAGGGPRDVDAARRPLVDDFDGGSSGSGREADESSSLPLPPPPLLLNVRCTLFKNNRPTAVLQYKL